MPGRHRWNPHFGSCFKNRGRNAIADNIVAERFDSPLQRLFEIGAGDVARLFLKNVFERGAGGVAKGRVGQGVSDFSCLMQVSVWCYRVGLQTRHAPLTRIRSFDPFS
jgi:hypothetical protein